MRPFAPVEDDHRSGGYYSRYFGVLPRQRGRAGSRRPHRRGGTGRAIPRIKHDAAFPTDAVQYCLREAGMTPADLDYVAFYEKPLRKLDRLLETYLAFAPRGFRNFGMALPSWLRDRLWIARTIRSALGIGRRPPLVFTEHHESHAASAFFPSPFEEAAILTLDGVGEWSTTTFGVGRGNRITLTDELTFPHSLGLLYSAFTYYCGFKVNSGEYKLMGLAPYGRPVFRDIILEHLVDLKPDGSLWLNMDCFNYCQGLTMTSARFERLFGGPPRAPESDLTQRHMDLAASIQVVTEEIVLRMAAALFERTRLTKVVLAGGVALNCVANGRLLREGPFEDLWVQPAAGDAGGALGAALFTWYQLLDKPRARTTVDAQQGSLLGPAWSDDEVAAFVRDSRLMARRFTGEADLLDEVTALLAAGRVVGWFQGRMEFAPRARQPQYPGRSARPWHASDDEPEGEMSREFSAVRAGRPQRGSLTIVRDRRPSRKPVHAARRTDTYRVETAPHGGSAGDHGDRSGLAGSREHCASTFAAVTHVDYSTRVQTVDLKRNARFHALLTRFQDRTGCPVLVNTSFNVRGEPIVCTPEDAYRCFIATDMDALVLENHLLLKDDAAPRLNATAREEHLARFQPD